MTTRLKLFASFLALAVPMAACTFEDSKSSPDDNTDAGGSDGQDGNDNQTEPEGDASVAEPVEDKCGSMPKPPVDVKPGDSEGLCISVPFKNIADQIDDGNDTFAKIDADVLANEACVGVAAPSGLTFVVGASLRKDATGAG